VAQAHAAERRAALAAAVAVGVMVNVLVRHVDNRIPSRILMVAGLAVIVAYAVQTVSLLV